MKIQIQSNHSEQSGAFRTHILGIFEMPALPLPGMTVVMVLGTLNHPEFSEGQKVYGVVAKDPATTVYSPGQDIDAMVFLDNVRVAE